MPSGVDGGLSLPHLGCIDFHVIFDELACELDIGTALFTPPAVSG